MSATGPSYLEVDAAMRIPRFPNRPGWAPDDIEKLRAVVGDKVGTLYGAPGDTWAARVSRLRADVPGTTELESGAALVVCVLRREACRVGRVGSPRLRDAAGD